MHVGYYPPPPGYRPAPPMWMHHGPPPGYPAPHAAAPHPQMIPGQYGAAPPARPVAGYPAAPAYAAPPGYAPPPRPMPGWPAPAPTAPAAAAAQPQHAHAAGPHRPQHPPPAAAAAAAVPAPRPVESGHVRLTPAPAAAAPGGKAAVAVVQAPPAEMVPDFADQKPQQYQAFQEMAVHSGEGGTTIGLPNNMCLDRHIPDFLLCLQTWLERSFGQPALTQRPWRLQGLDLSKNNLSNESLCKVIELLKELDVRVDRILFSHNRLDAKGLASLTEYIWNCKEAIVEVDVSHNEIVADPRLGQGGEDVVSSLLRCLYNHSNYPLILDQGGLKVLPFRLKIGGNRIADPARLLRMIKSRGGKTHVNIVPRPDAYDKTDEKEYLSIYLCDFLQQVDCPAQVPAATAQAASPAPAAPGKQKKAGKEKKEKKSKKDKIVEVPPEIEVPQEDARPNPKASKSKSKDKSGTPPSNVTTPGLFDGTGKEKRKRDKKDKKEKESKRVKTTAGYGSALVQVPPEDQQRLTDLLVAFFSSEDVGLGSDTNASMVAEYTVCMLISGKHWQALAVELQQFLPQESTEFMSTFYDWLKQTLEEQFPQIWLAVKEFAV